MSSLSEFFTRKGGAPVSEKSPALSPGIGPNGVDRPAETWAEMGSRIGSDNEALRNLLVNTGRQVSSLDDLKDAFSKLVEPISRTLRALEEEKSENVSLRGTLADVRSSYETLRADFNELGHRSSQNETEIGRLRHELEHSQQLAKSTEASKLELSDELSTVRARAAELERQIVLETANAKTLADENRALNEHASAADKRIVQLEGDASIARERLVLLENEKRSMQNSLEQMVSENSRLTRRLNESDNALSSVRARLEQTGAALATLEGERNKLTDTLDESNERRQTETNMLNMRLEAIQSRAIAAEKLLAEVRQNLVARTEENRLSERKVVETTIARQSVEKKLEQLLNSLQGQERQIRDLDGSRATLVERSSTLIKTVKSREISLARAEEKIQTLTDQLKRLETDSEANRVKTEKRIEELNSTLHKERLDRAVTDGALEATRKNYAELQRELAIERGGRREEPQSQAATEATLTPETPRVARIRAAKAADAKQDEAKPASGTVEPVVPS